MVDSKRDHERHMYHTEITARHSTVKTYYLNGTTLLNEHPNNDLQ